MPCTGSSDWNIPPVKKGNPSSNQCWKVILWKNSGHGSCSLLASRELATWRPECWWLAWVFSLRTLLPGTNKGYKSINHSLVISVPTTQSLVIRSPLWELVRPWVYSDVEQILGFGSLLQLNPRWRGSHLKKTGSFSWCGHGSSSSVEFSSVAQSCPIVCDPMSSIMPSLPVHHLLPEITQTYVHWVDDAIKPSHPLSSPSPPTPNPSQHQGLFQWVNSSHELAKVLEFRLQHQSFQWTPRTDLL